VKLSEKSRISEVAGCVKIAVTIALMNEVDLEGISSWAIRDRAWERFEEFLRALEQARVRKEKRQRLQR